ncbi:hypothetical protein AAGV28_07370 [Flavobacterium sp. FZUC8N2.13]|uniref:Lipoprotein n=1 Tax=Flavobacterium zubiriense TaxID=3138075 RepID=A0ABV4TD07_9FLAO
MKRSALLLGVALIALGFTSCKDEKEVQAKKTVETYVVYVDSLENVSTEDAQTNWESIDAVYQLRVSEAETALGNLKESAKEQDDINASRAKYEALKAKIQAANATANPVVNSKQKLRNTLFGDGKMGEDMSFTWVNKDNILSVYEAFFQSYKDNKENFSREDYDEIKMMYEGLDSRKNTVENEGLSSDDNAKIASIKLKFGPMFKINRMGAKSEEMAKAKE